MAAGPLRGRTPGSRGSTAVRVSRTLPGPRSQAEITLAPSRSTLSKFFLRVQRYLRTTAYERSRVTPAVLPPVPFVGKMKCIPSARIAAVINVESRAVHVFRARAAEPKNSGRNFFRFADPPGVNRPHHV